MTAPKPLLADMETVMSSARSFVEELSAADRQLKRDALTIPPADLRDRTTQAFWKMMASIADFEARGSSTLREREAFRAVVGEWMLRGRFWYGSLFKPHGYAGDYRIIEGMYDLESLGAADPTQPGILNILDHLYWTVHSVQSVAERRRWLAAILRSEHSRCLAGHGRGLRFLDIACGGARYVADLFESVDGEPPPDVTLVDQDAAAIAFCERRSLRAYTDNVTTLCVPLRRLDQHLSPDARFDVIASAGQFQLSGRCH